MEMSDFRESYEKEHRSWGDVSVWDAGSQNTVISGATYGPSGELLTLSGAANEARTYNSRLQLTGFNAMTFGYTAGANNGKVQTQTDAVSAEQVTYQYDALNWLISAVTTDNPNVSQWG